MTQNNFEDKINRAQAVNVAAEFMLNDKDLDANRFYSLVLHIYDIINTFNGDFVKSKDMRIRRGQAVKLALQRALNTNFLSLYDKDGILSTAEFYLDKLTNFQDIEIDMLKQLLKE